MISSSNVQKWFLRPLTEDFLPLVNNGTAGQGMQKLLKDYDFHTVLDVGSGEGLHAALFAKYGKKVTAVDFGTSVYFKKSSKVSDIDLFKGDFYDYPEDETFDCIWCSHILEHQLNPNLFLKKISRLLKSNGILAITVPPMKSDIVGGHFTLWNAGVLLYNLVMAEFDCSDPSILQYGYNITVIIRKKNFTLPDDLSFDRGDLEKLSEYFPYFVKQGFDGNIYEFNWYN